MADRGTMRSWLAAVATLLLGPLVAVAAEDALRREFVEPPAGARPWVYWYFMDGNMTREGMTADLEAWRKAGIGGGIFLEVDIGIPRGPVRFMSPEWRGMLAHAVSEAKRLDLQIALGTGPGWCGTGGPWVKPEQAMQHLVASETPVAGPAAFDAVLERPKPRTPFFGMGTLTPELKKLWEEYYRDVVVLAVPTPEGSAKIADVDEKALYHRAPYSSQPGVKPYLPLAGPTTLPAGQQSVASERVIDLTDKMQADGRLVWQVPEGRWTILRFGRTLTGQTTRPAPLPGLGLETDKFESAAVEAHLDGFVGTLLKEMGPVGGERGLTGLHFDSWEMSSQNWSESFRQEFRTRRGYDPVRYLPAMTGRVVDSVEVSERFLWDLRQTAQELVIARHMTPLRERAGKLGLTFSVEPYDMNPSADLALGGVADVPTCEFWSRGHGFETEYSCIEAVSVAHTMGRTVVAAEAFTAGDTDRWLQHPGSMKGQGDWALAAGINRLMFHRYQHQPKLDEYPGMTMGIYGVHWERTQTWWDMVPAYHRYLSRCQHLLRQGLHVADILYLAGEGAPHVFRAPKSATVGELPDRRGYNFDGCDPGVLIARATVGADGRVTFPDGMSYAVLVLPALDAMTPELLRKVKELAEAGATVVGMPPRRSPSLTGYPACDETVRRLAREIWGEGDARERKVGKGRVVRLEPAESAAPAGGVPELYPDYASVAAVLAPVLPPDVDAGERLRYAHRRTPEGDIYFVANRGAEVFSGNCTFRVEGRQPEWWDAVTGECWDLPEFKQAGGRTTVPLKLDALQSGFVVFRKPVTSRPAGRNFADVRPAFDVPGPWQVRFDPKFGGPASATFDSLVDWTTRPEEGIRHYSGKGVYRTTFDMPKAVGGAAFLSLGEVRHMASVRLNGRDLGVVWCAPWGVAVPAGVLRERGNELEVTVANLWVNRLIGDAGLPVEKRSTKTTWNPFKADDPLQSSGLLGPVVIHEVVR